MALKKLQELRNDKVAELQVIVGSAKLEERAMSEAEEASFEALDKEIKGIDATMKMEESKRFKGCYC